MKRLGVFGNTLLTYGSRILCVLMLLGVNVAVSRGLGPAGRGQYALLILISTIALLTGNLGTNISSLGLFQQRRSGLAAVSANALACVVVSSLSVGLLVVMSFFYFATNLYRGLELGWVTVAVGGAVFLSISMTNSYLLLAENRIVLVNVIDLIQNGSLFVSVVIVFLCRLNVVSVIMWAYLGTTMLTCLVSSILVFRYLSPDWHSLDRDLCISLVKYGVTVLPVNVFQLLNGRVALFLLNMWSSTEQLGYFAVAISVAELLRHFAEAVKTIMFGQLALSTRNEAVALTRSATRWITWSAMCGGAVLVLLAKPFIHVFFSRTYLPVVPLLGFIVFGSVFLAASSPMSSLLLTRGYGARQTRAAAIGMGLNVTLSVALIPRWGTSAAAFAYSASFLALACVVSIDYYRHFGEKEGWEWLLPSRADWRAISARIGVLTRSCTISEPRGGLR